jgi:hypothetical protein
LAQFGETLTTFPLPLFPAEEPYDLPNAKLLREAGGPQGGASHPRTTVYRRTRGNDDLLGAGTFPVIQNPQTGAPEVDVTKIEVAFDNAFNQLRALQAKVDELGKNRTPEKERTPEEKKIYALTSAVRDLRRAVVTAQESALHRTHYRPRPRGPRGGENPSEEVDF